MAIVKARRWIVWLGCAALWTTLGGVGCDLFRPANPEPPLEGSIPAGYGDPDQTLNMIALAIQDKARTNGSSVYIGAFAESTAATTPAYHHFFWPSDIDNCASCGGVAPDWGIALERDFYNKFVNLRGDEYQMTWVADDTRPDDIRETRAEIHRHYEITTQTTDGMITGALAKGFADLVLVKGVDGNWRITIWDDRIDPSADPGAEEVSLGRRRLGAR